MPMKPKTCKRTRTLEHRLLVCVPIGFETRWIPHSGENLRRAHRRQAYVPNPVAKVSSQIFNQLEYVASVFRGDSSRAVVRAAVLPLVVLLEQTAKSVARAGIKFESFRCGFRVHGIWVNAVVWRSEGGFQSNNSRGVRIIFPRGCIVMTQLVHQLGCFMLQRRNAPGLTVIQPRSPNLPTRKHKQHCEGQRLGCPETAMHIKRLEFSRAR